MPTSRHQAPQPKISAPLADDTSVSANTITDALVAEISVHLAIATQHCDAEREWKKLSQHLPCGSVALYRFSAAHSKASMLYQCHSKECNELFPDTQLFPDTMVETSEQLQHIFACDGKDFHAIEHSGDLPSDAYVLAIVKQRKKIGFVVFHGGDKTEWLKLKRSLQQCAFQFLETETRIAKRRKNHDQNRVLHQLLTESEESFASWTATGGWIFHNTHLLQRIAKLPTDFSFINVFGHPDFMGTAQWQAANLQLENSIHNGTDLLHQYEVVLPDGQGYIFQTDIKVRNRDANGAATHLTAVSVDITENKRFVNTMSENAELDAWLLTLSGNLFNQCNAESIQNTLRLVAERFDFDRAYIRLFDAVKQEAPLFLEWAKPGLEPMSVAFPNVPIDLDTANQTHVIQDTALPTKNRVVNQFRDTLPGKAYISRPFYFNDALAGLVIFQNVNPRKFGRLEKRAAHVITDAISMVITKENLLKRLESSRERFEMAMDAASYGLWEYNLLNQTIYLSPNYYEMLGYDPEKFTGFRPLVVDNIHFDDKQTVIDYTQKLVRGEVEEFSLEARHLTKNGDLLWILMRGKIIKWDDIGRPIRAMGTMTDITALKKTQTDLQLAHQEALSAHQAKSEFLARMSHEIRTPMNAIIGMTYLALQAHLTKEQHDYLIDIDHAAKSLLHIIDDILDFSKIEAGKLTIEYHPFDFAALCERTAHYFKGIAKTKQLDFNFEFAADAPRYISGDSTRITQALEYLLNNAFKFTNTGGVTLIVRKLREAGEKIILQFIIRDTGIGLSNEQIDQLFTAFTQADGSSSRQYGGTGLGLAISKHLVEMMGGAIYVSSHPGYGSEFTFTVECFLANETTVEAVSDERTILGEHLNAKKVLLVEDNKVNQKVAAGILKKRQMNVTIANNGAEAVYMMKACDANRFDVILMDIEMPYMGGLEATTTIRQIARHKHIPIIGMTAHMVGDDKPIYLNAGMTDCVSKPISPAMLYTLLEQYLAPNSP